MSFLWPGYWRNEIVSIKEPSTANKGRLRWIIQLKPTKCMPNYIQEVWFRDTGTYCFAEKNTINFYKDVN